MSTKMSHILKQTCSFQLRICLSICDLLVDTRNQRVKPRILESHPWLNLEKHHAILSQMHSVIINQNENTDLDEINKQIFVFA